MAAECELRCDDLILHEQLAQSTPVKEMAQDHSCCKNKQSENTDKQGKQNKKEKSCEHHSFSTHQDQDSVAKLSLLHSQEISFFGYFSNSFSSSKLDFYRHIQPKIPEDSNPFLKYKSRLRLHILKDQFLI